MHYLCRIKFLNMAKSFGSDNHSGIHPRVLEALARANEGHTPAYGDDPYTAQFEQMIKQMFGSQAAGYLVMNGTGANILSLKAVAAPYNSVICPTTAHINVDECAAPESNIGCKLVTVATPDGKLTPELVKPYLFGFGFQHHAQPRVISISESTELGTLYTIDEVKALAALAHEYGMLLHMDGARFANAVAALGCTPAQLTAEAGVDILSFGGTKNGLLLADAVVFMNGQIAPNFLYQRKNAMQLASKMRFLAAQFVEYLTDGLWLELAANSNRMAKLLASEIADIQGINMTQKVESNAVFAILPEDKLKKLHEHYTFYDWDEARCEARWMCSWNTTEQDVEEFVRGLKRVMSE